MGLSCTVPEIDCDYRRKFPTHPLHFAPPLKGWLLELVTGAGGQKTRMMGLPGRERSLMISSTIWIQCTNVQTARRTDEQTDTGRQQRPRLCIASTRAVMSQLQKEQYNRRRKLLGRAGRDPPTLWPLWAAAMLCPPTFSHVKTKCSIICLSMKFFVADRR